MLGWRRKTLPNLVKDSGRKDAPIVIIGEAPGQVENSCRQPFRGPAGQRLAYWLSKVGLERARHCYVTNTYPYQPPHNKLNLIPAQERAKWVKKLHETIAALEHPLILVPMGNYALEALTGMTGISNHRGSVYRYVDLNGRKLKVVPVLHPAFTLYEPAKEPVCIQDFEKIRREMNSPKIKRKKRLRHISPTVRDMWDYLQARKKDGRELAVDIETPKVFKTIVTGKYKNGKDKTKKIAAGKIIACIGFAHSSRASICIPLTKSYWSTQAQLDEVLGYVRELLLLDNPKIFQYGWYDTYCLRRLLGLRVRRWFWDTKDMHHALEPNDSHSLAYMASRDSNEPYWKDEGKSEGRGIPKDLHRYWNYNCTDVLLTWELAQKYKKRLAAAGKLAFYKDHYRSMYVPVLRMSLQGLRLDAQRRAQKHQDLTDACTQIKKALTKIAGEPLYGAKGSLSPTKLQRFLYDTLGLKEQLLKDKKTGMMKRTANEVAVRKVQRRYGHKDDVVEACQLILDHKRFDKVRQFVSENVADVDGYMRSAYSFSPITGRFSSSKNALGTGTNAQNQDREIRDIYLPEPGCLFLEVDESQAESRIVFMRTGDRELIELARTPPWAFDVHTANAATLFHISESDVTKTQRYLGKRAVHAGHYGMQGKKLSDIFLLDGYAVPEDEAQKLIDTYLEWRAPIVDVFQRHTRQLIMRDRAMTNTWGRTVSFKYDRLSDELYRLGYAWYPQSVVPDIINQWGIRPLSGWNKAVRPKLHLQGHDSMLLSVKPANVWETMRRLQASLEQAISYMTPLGRKARPLTIPVEFKLSTRWATEGAAKAGDVIEWKSPPTKQQVLDAVEQLRPRMAA